VVTVGRTNPTFRDFLDRYEDRFGDYRRALRHQSQADFDRLFQRARAHADAPGYANHLDRDRLVLLSMTLGQETALREREEEIGQLRAEVDALHTELEELHATLEGQQAEQATPHSTEPGRAAPTEE
jgi:DNA repair exonuclease SbcCD ATPase subunit